MKRKYFYSYIHIHIKIRLIILNYSIKNFRSIIFNIELRLNDKMNMNSHKRQGSSGSFNTEHYSTSFSSLENFMIVSKLMQDEIMVPSKLMDKVFGILTKSLVYIHHLKLIVRTQKATKQRQMEAMEIRGRNNQVMFQTTTGLFYSFVLNSLKPIHSKALRSIIKPNSRIRSLRLFMTT